MSWCGVGGGGCVRQKKGQSLRAALEGSEGEERRGEGRFRVAMKTTEALQEFGNQ